MINMAKRTEQHMMSRTRELVKRMMGPSTFEMFGTSDEKLAKLKKDAEYWSKFVDELSDEGVLKLLKESS